MDTANSLGEIFSDLHLGLTHVFTMEDATELLQSNRGNISMAIVDLSANESDTVNLLDKIRKKHPSLPLATIINSTADDSFKSEYRIGTIKKPIQANSAADYLEPIVTNIIGVAPTTNMIDIAVKDSGIGIPADELHKVFRQFYQIDRSQKREHRGTGLGLAICREIIKHYGGKIWVSSELGQGSTFHILLPELKENKKKLGEILVEKGIVTEKQLSDPLSQQR